MPDLAAPHRRGTSAPSAARARAGSDDRVAGVMERETDLPLLIGIRLVSGEEKEGLLKRSWNMAAAD